MLDRELEQTLLPICKEKNVTVLSYSSLALGLLSGQIDPKRRFDGDDLRNNNPRFSQQNREHVAAFAETVKPVADAYNASIAQLVIAWTITQPGITYALCGARDVKQATENAQAGKIELSPEHLAMIDAAAAQYHSQVSG